MRCYIELGSGFDDSDCYEIERQLSSRRPLKRDTHHTRAEFMKGVNRAQHRSKPPKGVMASTVKFVAGHSEQQTMPPLEPEQLPLATADVMNGPVVLQILQSEAPNGLPIPLRVDTAAYDTFVPPNQ